MENNISKIEFDEEGLKSLTQRILNDLDDDLLEIQSNINRYKEKMEDPTGFDVYGSLFNDSLKVKGSIRDKFLKIALMIKDKAAKTKDNDKSYSQEDIAALANEILEYGGGQK